MSGTLKAIVLSIGVLSIGCSAGPSAVELLADLREMQQRQHVYIGFVDEPQGHVNLVEPNENVNGGTQQVKLPRERLQAIRADSSHASFRRDESRSLPSPNGKLIVRSRGGEPVLDIPGGKHQAVARTANVVGSVHWSPDSAFLMYLERAPKWDPMALRILDNVVYVTVYRCRDGRKGHLRAFGEGAASAPWEWLRIPPELLTTR